MQLNISFILVVRQDFPRQRLLLRVRVSSCRRWYCNGTLRRGSSVDALNGSLVRLVLNVHKH